MIQDIFKNNPNNSNGTLNNSQLDNNGIVPQESTNNAGTNQQNEENEMTNDQNNAESSSDSNSDNGGISSSEAQSIADNYIEEPGASSGTPKTVNIGGEDTYVVPVESEGNNVGEIHIDPQTGENVGGAGGAP
jgi:hypothetical protein